MISNSREKGVTTDKEEGNKYCKKNEQIKDSCSTWSGLKNPRIVRVSRAFGGKDRHSKVTTVRGLRDRRIRLSVQTAIQLYDLQEKLGFNQPSKVVDWLINAAQHEIDKLPPLQMPPGSNCFPFPQFMNPLMYGFDNNRIQAQNGVTTKDNDNSLYWIRSEEAMKKRVNDNQASSSRANVEDQSVIMLNNPTSQVPYSLQDSMNAYMYYSGNHSSQPEVFNPIPPLGTNFDWKNYSNFHSLSLISSSQGNQAFKNQRTRNDEHEIK